MTCAALNTEHLRAVATEAREHFAGEYLPGFVMLLEQIAGRKTKAEGLIGCIDTMTSIEDGDLALVCSALSRLATRSAMRQDKKEVAFAVLHDLAADMRATGYLVDPTPDDDVLPALRDPLELDAQYRLVDQYRIAGAL